MADILWSLYILLLFPFLYECEKAEHKGLKILLIGILLTPVAGYIALFFYKRNKIKEKSTLL